MFVKGKFWLTGAALAVSTLALGGSVVALQAEDRPLTDFLVRDGVPWPAEGQAAAGVEDAGSLGVSGERTPVPIASVTKVMTAYVVLRDHPLTREADGPDILIDQQAEDEASRRDESTVWLRAGAEVSERDLLALMLVPSGNNVARLLARWNAGSEQAFVAKMNAAAAGLGMTRTTYTGASGLEDSTTSTAEDQLRLLREVMRDEVFRDIVAQPSVAVRGVAGRYANTNTLLGHSGVVGVKTGSSTAAGGALMWAAEASSPRVPGLILGVVLGQNTGEAPAAGLATALEVSKPFIAGLQQSLDRRSGTD
ncbi:serine hydrolase [Amycolatopsis endophytica]|uniref:D-alanyl-D-alanine carboxypeptidase (Penicillin-binding protein 5/6) n=1 Tax=Amycolatopsis endophytica TaxID=860233 RepID=A0A853BD60_9PSEU|nr:serine hydrolase [Amycolatopsis endophytica]NYI93159.1 D-alanyl-D-alanine carboxypeptidase (penicillin-binding protein 5/6) [Amycolatopsis endophytica]